VTERISTENEVVTVVTTGDRERGSITDKAKWVSELEAALLEGSIDLAVHSAKDVPTKILSEFELLGVPLKSDSRDALCGKYRLKDLPTGARVGTSSLRRKSQLLSIRPDLDVKPLHGNIDTRLKKLESGEYDALLLAAAGLQRLNSTQSVAEYLECSDFVPAAGQGALLVEVCNGRSEVIKNFLDTDLQATNLLMTERLILDLLQADCDSPIGLHAEHTESGQISVRTYAGLEDGSNWLRDQITLPTNSPSELAKTVVERLISLGVKEFLAN